MKCPNCGSDDIGWEDPLSNRRNREYNRTHPYDPIVGMVAPHWRECRSCGCQFLQDEAGRVRYSQDWLRTHEEFKHAIESVKAQSESKQK